MNIDDGQGRSRKAGVDRVNRLKTSAVSLPIQQYISADHGGAYQVSGSVSIAGAGTYNVLHVRNDSGTALAVATYIRPSAIAITGGTFGIATYFEMDFGGNYASAGTQVIPVNMNQTSGNEAPVTAYGNNPTLTTDTQPLVPFDYWYPDGVTGNFSFNKQGTLILGKNDTVTFRFVTDHTSGLAFIRLSFLSVDKGLLD